MAGHLQDLLAAAVVIGQEEQIVNIKLQLQHQMAALTPAAEGVAGQILAQQVQAVRV
jgi:hypothetical protein